MAEVCCQTLSSCWKSLTGGVIQNVGDEPIRAVASDHCLFGMVSFQMDGQVHSRENLGVADVDGFFVEQGIRIFDSAKSLHPRVTYRGQGFYKMHDLCAAVVKINPGDGYVDLYLDQGLFCYFFGGSFVLPNQYRSMGIDKIIPIYFRASSE